MSSIATPTGRTRAAALAAVSLFIAGALGTSGVGAQNADRVHDLDGQNDMWIGPLDPGHHTRQLERPIDVVLHDEGVVGGGGHCQAQRPENGRNCEVRSHMLEARSVR